MSDRLRATLVGVITVLICGIMIYTSFMPLADLGPRAIALIERGTGIR